MAWFLIPYGWQLAQPPLPLDHQFLEMLPF